MLRAGSRVGDFEIEADLGEGGMAHVYVARHPLLDTRHAIKVLAPELRANTEARQRFLDEARIQAKHLDHPGIVKVTYVVATEDHAALVMELIDGPSLESEISNLVARPDEVRRIMLGVLDAIGHAHQAGIIHRDLKPANVLLAGRARTPKVTDFGIAKIGDDLRRPAKKSTRAEARMGTLNYSSPEQVLSAKTVTPRSDIFSLGVMLYELSTGVLPFDAENDYELMDQIVKGRYAAPEVVNPHIDPVLAAVAVRAMDTRPERRFASCAEMADALRARPGVPTEPSYPSTAPVPAPPPRSLEASPPGDSHAELESEPRRAHASRRIMLAGVAAISVIAIGVFVFTRGRATGEDEKANAATPTKPRSNERMQPIRVTASSTMKPFGSYTFEPSNLTDGNLTTSWQPSSRELHNGATWIQMEFDREISVASVRVANGFQVVDKNGDEFLLNSRVAIARALFSDGTPLLLQFSGNERGLTHFDVFPPKATRSIRIVIDKIHRGAQRQKGSPLTDDLALSEVEVIASDEP